MSQDKIPIFCYHGIGNQREYDVGKEKFSEQVEWLNENYDLLTVSEIFEKKREGKLPENPAALTFDDGLKSAFEARKILDKHDVKATFYIVSGIIGEFWEGEKVMSKTDVKMLSDEGHEIGSHTVSHPFLTELREENIENEIRKSKEKLEDITGENVNTLAYPFGDYNSKVEEIIEETGIETAFTTKPKLVRDFRGPHRTPRLTVFNQHELKHLKNMSRGKNLFYRNYWCVIFGVMKGKSLPTYLKRLIKRIA